MSLFEGLTCCICGFQSDYSLTSHISRKHMSMDEYHSLFPGNVVQRARLDATQKMKETKSKKDSAHKRFKLELDSRKHEWTDSIKCVLCGFSSHSSLISHIIRKHGMKLSDYRMQFPDAVVQRMNSSQKEKLSNTNKKKLQDPDARAAFLEWRSFPSEMKHWLRKGLSLDEARSKVTSVQSAAGKAQNDHPELLVRKSELSSGDANPMSLVSIAERYNTSIEEASKLTPAFGRSGEKHPMFGKHHTEEAKAAIAKNMPVTFTSRGEKDVFYFLNSIHHFRNNVGVSNWNCDAVSDSKRIIVEYFGDYWHCRPTRYQQDWFHPRVKKTAFEIWQRDQKKIDDLTALGYKVIVIWESDWKKDQQRVMQEIKDAIDQA